MEYTGSMAYRPYREAVLSGEFTPSQKALEADAYIASTSPETHPDKYTFLGTVGWVYTGPERFDTSLTEYTAFVNQGLGNNSFGPRKSGTFSDIYDDPDPKPPQETSSFNYMTDEELAAYNEANNTSFSGNYLSTNPNTGEAGMWTWDPQAGWRDDTQWTGPRTTYDDGTPITSFEDVRDGVFDDPSPAADADTTQPPAKKADSAAADPAEDVVSDVTDSNTTNPFDSSGMFTGSGYTVSTPLTLNYSLPSAATVSDSLSTGKMDFVKMLRGYLNNSLFKDYT